MTNLPLRGKSWIVISSKNPLDTNSKLSNSFGGFAFLRNTDVGVLQN
jgi:hypothetical protein